MINRQRKSRPARSLTATLAIAFFALSVVALLMAGVLQIYANYRTQQQAIASKQQLLAQGAASTVTSFIENEFSVMATTVRLASPAKTSAEEQVRILNSLLGLQPAFRQLVILDAQGQETAMTSRVSRSASGQIAARLDKAALAQIQQGQKYISAVYFDEFTSEPFVLIAVPATSILGDFEGYMIAEVNLKFMWDLVDQLKVGETGVTYVVDRQGNLIAYKDTARVLRGETVDKLRKVNEFMSGSMGGKLSSELYTGIESKTVVGTLIPLVTPDWAVVIEMPWQEAYQQVIQQIFFSVAIILVIAVFASTIGILLARRLAVSLVQLTKVATRITSGEADVQAEVGGPREVASLATAFNTMTSRLRGMLGTLEQRVADRTRELALAAEIGRGVSQMHDLDILLPNAVESIRSQFNLYYAQIYLMDASERTLTLRAGTGGVGAELLRRGHRLAVGPGSINGVAAGERKAIIVADTASNPIFRPNPLLPETRSEMAVPLLVGERVVGVMDLQSRQPGALSAENLQVFEALAGQLAVALDNASLFAQIEQARREVEEQTRRLTQTGWREFLNALERDERIGYLYDQNSLSPFNEPLPETQAENTVKSPLVVSGTPVGSIQLERAGDQPWQSEEADLVTAIVDQASRQLDNLRLLAQAESYRIEAEDAARRLTRAGWKEYLQTKKDASGYVYNQINVLPLDYGQKDRLDRPAEEPGKSMVQPVKIGTEVVGELAFDGIDMLDPASQELVNNVAELLGSHVDGLRLTEQTQKALIQTEELYSSSAQVVRSSSIDGVLHSLIETTSLSRFDRGTIIFFDQPWVDEVPEAGIVAGNWDRLGKEAPVPVGSANLLRHTPFAQILRRDELVIISDVLTDTRLDDKLRSQLQEVGRSLVFYPLVAGDSWFGFLSVAASQPVHMTDEEIRPIQTLVGQAATVMQSIRLLQDAQARAQREQALRQITSAVRGSNNADTILRTATRELGVVLGRKVKVQLGEALGTSDALGTSEAQQSVGG